MESLNRSRENCPHPGNLCIRSCTHTWVDGRGVSHQQRYERCRGADSHHVFTRLFIWPGPEEKKEKRKCRNLHERMHSSPAGDSHCAAVRMLFHCLSKVTRDLGPACSCRSGKCFFLKVVLSQQGQHIPSLRGTSPLQPCVPTQSAEVLLPVPSTGYPSCCSMARMT